MIAFFQLTKGVQDEVLMIFANDVVLSRIQMCAWTLQWNIGLEIYRAKTEFLEFGFKNELRRNRSYYNARLGYWLMLIK